MPTETLLENHSSNKPSAEKDSPASLKALRIAGDSTRFFLSELVSQAVGVLRGLVIPNLLGPIHYGVVSSLMLIEHYARYANLGIHTNNLFKLPAQRALHQWEKAEEIKNSVFSVSLLTGCLATGALLGVAWLRWETFPREMRWPLVAASLIPLLINLRAVFMTLLRTDKEFSLLAAATIWVSLGGMGLGILFALWFKAFGVFLAQALVGISVLLWIKKRRQYQFQWNMKWRSVKPLLQFSIPVFFIIGLLHTWLETIDRIMVVKHFGVLSVGYYSIASLLSTPVGLIPTVIGTVMSTDVIESCAQNPQRVQRQLIQSTYLVAFSSVFIAGVISLFSPLILRCLFPKYIPALKIVQWLPLVAYFQTIGMFGYYVAMSAGQIRPYLLIVGGLAAGVYFLFDIGCRGGHLATVVFFMAVACILRAVILLGFTVWSTVPNRVHAARFTGHILLLGALAMGGCALLHACWPTESGGSLGSLWTDTLLKTVCYVAGWGLIVYGLRRYVDWAEVRQVAIQKWRRR